MFERLSNGKFRIRKDFLHEVYTVLLYHRQQFAKARDRIQRYYDSEHSHHYHNTLLYYQHAVSAMDRLIAAVKQGHEETGLRYAFQCADILISHFGDDDGVSGSIVSGIMEDINAASRPNTGRDTPDSEGDDIQGDISRWADDGGPVADNTDTVDP